MTVSYTHLNIADVYQDAPWHGKELLGRRVPVWRNEPEAEHLSIEQRQFHIVNHIQRINQVERLEYKAQGLVTELSLIHISPKPPVQVA